MEKRIACKEDDSRFPWKTFRGLAPKKIRVSEIKPRFILSEGEEYLMMFERPKIHSGGWKTNVGSQAIYIQDIMLVVITSWHTPKFGGKSVYYFVKEGDIWVRARRNSNAVKAAFSVLGLLDASDFDSHDYAVFKEALEAVQAGTKSYDNDGLQGRLFKKNQTMKKVPLGMSKPKRVKFVLKPLSRQK